MDITDDGDTFVTGGNDKLVKVRNIYHFAKMMTKNVTTVIVYFRKVNKQSSYLFRNNNIYS